MLTSTNAAGVTPEDIGSLRHMLGAVPRYPKHKWGWRNYFLAGRGAQQESMMRLVAAAYAIEGRAMDDGERYYHSTPKGCEAAGMSKAAIKRLFP